MTRARRFRGTFWRPFLRVSGIFAIAISMLAACSGRPGNSSPEGMQGSSEPSGPRLYVLEGGVLVSNPASYDLSNAEVQSAELSIAAYLIAHPEGVLLYDTLGIADVERIPDGTGVRQTIIRPDGQERHVTLGPSLREQLAEIGYTPGEVTHLALSHLHWDHSANANMFADAVWLVRPLEHELMFSDEPGGSARPDKYSALANSETILITDDEYDVFGDGSVVLKAAPGHSPGHQVLFVDLPATGGVVLSGDLYHYPEERSLDRYPISEYDKAATRASRAEVEAFLTRTGAELWIGHDLTAHRQLRKSPEYYD